MRSSRVLLKWLTQAHRDAPNARHAGPSSKETSRQIDNARTHTHTHTHSHTCPHTYAHLHGEGGRERERKRWVQTDRRTDGQIERERRDKR